MKAIAATALFVALIVGATIATPASGGTPPTPTVQGCVITFSTLNGSGTLAVPAALDDAAHDCIGITSVTVDAAGWLVLGHESSIVVTAIVDEDETLADRSIECGASAGTTQTWVACYQAGDFVRADSLEMYGPYANLWFYAVRA